MFQGLSHNRNCWDFLAKTKLGFSFFAIQTFDDVCGFKGPKGCGEAKCINNYGFWNQGLVLPRQVDILPPEPSGKKMQTKRLTHGSTLFISLSLASKFAKPSSVLATICSSMLELKIKMIGYKIYLRALIFARRWTTKTIVEIRKEIIANRSDWYSTLCWSGPTRAGASSWRKDKISEVDRRPQCHRALPVVR